MVFGGHHASADAETVIQSHKQTINVIIKGEGERALYELLYNYRNLDLVSDAIYI
jgi:radical SAM superfamily enzyme YgiQ (UPF0313 family)